MGWFDYVSDLYSSAAMIRDAHADVQDSMKYQTTNDSSSKDQKGGGIGTAQQDRGAAVKGGASTSTPHSGTNEESESEAEVNKADKKASGSDEKGHTPGEGGEASGQVGKDRAGPHGGSVGKESGDDEGAGEDEAGSEDEQDEEAEEEEEEEEEPEEPEDPMPKLQAECEKTKACAPLKHHYDDCAERVTHQQEEHGKADEDCVEEFFHLMHCTSQCAAPKLFRQLR